MDKVYLGDSVYVQLVDGMLMLTTDNGLGPTNTIYLEPRVFHALVAYVARLTPEAEGPEKET